MAVETPTEKLAAISEALKSGEDAEFISVRDFIWWWYAERRSFWTVWRIKKALEEVGLKTVPDFQSTYLDAFITFELNIDEGEFEIEEANEIDVEAALTFEDPTYRISKLKAANQKVISVKPEASLEEAVTVMMEHDLSQIPIMTNDRDVKGMITWQSIGTRLTINPPKREARFFMERAQIVPSSESIFEIIDQVVKYDYALVRENDNRISGIITASDLSVQFRQLSEAFLILSEIENTLRILIERKFSVDELRSNRDPSDPDRVIEGAADLTFGEFVRLLENPDRWKKFSIGIDRAKFCESLGKVRAIRNDVMHFDPDGIPEADLKRLQDFSKLLRKILQVLS